MPSPYNSNATIYILGRVIEFVLQHMNHKIRLCEGITCPIKFNLVWVLTYMGFIFWSAKKNYYQYLGYENFNQENILKYLPIFFNVFSEVEFWFWIFLPESNGCKNNNSHVQDVLHQQQANSSFIHQLTWMLNIHVSFLSFVRFISIFHVPPSISSNLPPLSKIFKKSRLQSGFCLS
jgi:hypothetical protein